MAAPVAHPRRRPQKATAAQMTPSLDTFSIAMSLRKSDTFSARTKTPSDLINPLEAASLLPKRSPTNTKDLEELLSVDKHVDQISKLLADFDLICKGGKGLVGDASILNEKDVLAVPNFLVKQASVQEQMETDDTAAVNDHHHDSDSGLGSSIASSHEDCKPARTSTRISSRSSVASSHSTITQSASAINSNTPHTTQFLSKQAVQHIQKYIVNPILREPSLKEFHPLIEDIPCRIGAKWITNLRDLEKTLFFLAPRYTSSPKKFLQFCETSIQCLQTTVDFVCEREQRKPTDRPYTNNYFIDLVEQIRRYAEIMKRTREKQEKGEPLDEMDYSPDEQITIKGGLAANGKPAELVRNKNGKAMSLADHDSTMDSTKGSLSKRPLEDDDDDMEEVYRSMARRRKSDKAGDVMHPCRVCDKEFKRPCDLTKHEKTHSRPWKCPESKCRYHDMGWPTEKERDRHVNDKHSAAPAMYKCQFSPCTYSSKRESNCKQHMEKAHGWEYVRSKSNGRKRSGMASVSGSTANRTPATPLTPFMATPASDFHHLATPDSAFAPSPFAPADNTFFNGGDFRYTPAPSNDDLFSLGGNSAFDRRESITTAGTFSSTFVSPEQPIHNSFEEAIGAVDVNTFNFDFNNLAPIPNQQQYQQPTPALSIGDNFAADFMAPMKASPTNAMAQPQVIQNPHLSPFAQGDPTLFSPEDNYSPFDEGFGDANDMNLGGDFTLFDTAGASYDHSPAPGEAGPSNWNDAPTNNAMDLTWFPDATIGGMGGQFDFGDFANVGKMDGWQWP